MKTGDLVNVQTFSEGEVTRRVVEITDKTVYICTDEEWQCALLEGRDPGCAGFKREYVRPFSK